MAEEEARYRRKTVFAGEVHTLENFKDLLIPIVLMLLIDSGMIKACGTLI